MSLVTGSLLHGPLKLYVSHIVTWQRWYAAIFETLTGDMRNKTTWPGYGLRPVLGRLVP